MSTPKVSFLDLVDSIINDGQRPKIERRPRPDVNYEDYVGDGEPDDEDVDAGRARRANPREGVTQAPAKDGNQGERKRRSNQGGQRSGNQESRSKGQQSRSKGQPSRSKGQQSRSKGQQSRSRDQQSRSRDQQSRSRDQQSRSKDQRNPGAEGEGQKRRRRRRRRKPGTGGPSKPQQGPQNKG